MVVNTVFVGCAAAAIPTVGMAASFKTCCLITLLSFAIQMASSASIPVPVVSNLPGMGSAPKRPTYVDVTKGATSCSAGARPSSSRLVPEAMASGHGGVSGGNELGKVLPKQPDEQVDAGEGEGGVGKVGADAPGRTDEQPDAGEGVSDDGKVGEVPPGQTDEQPQGVEAEGEMTEGQMRDPVVVITFPNMLAITRQPLVSVVNPDGFSMVSKTELATHFLPEEWTGTIVLQLERGDGEMLRMSPGWDADGTDLLWSLGPGEYVMEVAKARAPKGGSRGGGGGRGAPRMQCSSGPTSVARSVRTGFMSAATSFASGFGGKGFASKKAPLRGDGVKSKVNEAEKSGIHIGSSSERRSKHVDWGRGWSKNVRENAEEEVSSRIGSKDEGERREERKAAEESPLDEWARGMLRGGKEQKRKEKNILDKEVVERMAEAWEKEEEGNTEKQETEESLFNTEKGRGDVTDAVLLSARINPTNRLKVLLERAKSEKVEGFEGPVDGDRVLLMSAENYTSRGVKDGRYWGK